ncbi:MAG: phage tail protein [Firmicutes bacterium]|nr:phage tail protein [Bacillota bacterium]
MAVYFFNQYMELCFTVPETAIVSSDQESTLGGLITHETEVIEQDGLKDMAYFGLKDPLDRSNFVVYKITMTKSDDGKTRTFQGIHKFFDDLKGGYIKDRRPSGNISLALSIILQDTGWDLLAYDVTKKASLNMYYVSKITAFWDLQKASEFDFIPRINFSNGKIINQTLLVSDKIMQDNGRLFSESDKLVELIDESDKADIYTAFVGLGKGEEKYDSKGEATGGYGRKINFSDVEWAIANKDPVDKPIGQEYVEIKEATEAYGYKGLIPRIGLVDFSDCEDKTELLKLTYEYAKNNARPKKQFKATIIEPNHIALGERVRVKSKDREIAYETRVFKVKRSFLNPQIQTIEFGDNLTPTSADRFMRIEREERKKEERIGESLGEVRKGILESWKNDDAYNYEFDRSNTYGLPGGYYSFDKPVDQNPTKVIGISAGRLIIANSKLSDGSWNFTTFGTGEGFSADLIRSGTLIADLVKAGVLSDKAANNYWDMENGSISIGGGALSYSKEEGFKVKIVDDLRSDLNKKTTDLRNDVDTAIENKADKAHIISEINASREGISISGDRITLTGSTEVRGDFKVAGSALFGTINAQYIDVDNLNANNINRGVLGRGVNNGSCSLPEGGSAYLSGRGTNFDTGSSRFRFIYDSGSYQNTFLVDGRITAEPISGQHMAFQSGGLYVGANGGSLTINPGSYGVNFQASGPCMFDNRISCSGLSIGSARLTEADINKLHNL